MFGWEFPPHISGGLGTACEGLTMALNKADVEIIFVVPRLYGDENTPFRIINAREVPFRVRSARSHHVDDLASSRTGNATFKNQTLETSLETPAKGVHDRASFNEETSLYDDMGMDVDDDVLSSNGSADSVSSGGSPERHNEVYGRKETNGATASDLPARPRILTIAIPSPLQAYAPSAVIPNRHERYVLKERTHAVHRSVRSEEGPSPIPNYDKKTAIDGVHVASAVRNVSGNDRTPDVHAGLELRTTPAAQHTMKEELVVKEDEASDRSVEDETAGGDIHEHDGPIFYPFSGRYDQDLLTEVERYADAAAEVAGAQTFDIIHAHDWITFAAGIAAKKKSGKKLVLHVHATEIDRSGSSPDPRIFAIEQRGLMEADQIISVSNWTKQTLIRHYRIPPSKITVVHNGIISTEIPSKKANDIFRVPIVSFAGRITYQKGPLYFVEAAFKVLQRFPEVHFVMAGSGDQLSAVIDQVSHLRMDRHFSFTGFLKGRDIERLWSLTHVYVMPSVSEPFGITPLEAIRAGVPVIVSKQAGVSEVMPHAIKVDFWNTDELANAICSMIAYPQLAKSLATNAHMELKNLTWERAANIVKSLYQRVVDV